MPYNRWQLSVSVLSTSSVKIMFTDPGGKCDLIHEIRDELLGMTDTPLAKIWGCGMKGAKSKAYEYAMEF